MKFVDLLKAVGVALLIGAVIVLLPFVVGLLLVIASCFLFALFVGVLYLYFRDVREKASQSNDSPI